MAISPLPPLVAYRADLAARRVLAPFTPRDAHWLAMACVVERAAAASSDALAQTAAGKELLARRRDWVAADACGTARPRDVVVAMAKEMEDSGALRLAYTTLHSLVHAFAPSVRERGRTLAQAARVARQLGEVEAAAVLYRTVRELGRDHGDPDLRARAELGLGLLAQVRGNYPAARAHFRRALRQAATSDSTTRDVTAIAHQGLLVAAAVRGAFDVALRHGWAAFQRADADPERAAEALLNLGQLLSDMGHFSSALSAFTASLAHRPVTRLLLPALGGAAVAAAALGDHQLVSSIHRRVRATAEPNVFPYVAASAYVDLCRAFARLGDSDALRQVAADAKRYGVAQHYHELAHHIDQLEHAPPRPLRARAAAVERGVAALATPADLHALI